MAANTVSSSSSAIVTSQSSGTLSAIVSAPALPSFSHQLPDKLDSTNFVLWKTLIRPMIAGCGLLSHIDGSGVVPPASAQPNSEYQLWFRADQQVLSWLFNSISPSLLPQIIGVETAREAWVKLEQAYASGSIAQGRELKQQLHSLVKSHSESVVEYMQRAKLISDRLISLQNPVSEADLVDAVVDGLRGPLRDVCWNVATRTISFADLLGILMTEERHLQREKALTEDINSPSVHFTARTGSGNSRGRGRGRNNQRQQPRGGYTNRRQQRFDSSPSSPATARSGRYTTFAPLDISTPRCYNCHGFGHMANECPTDPATLHRNHNPTAHHTSSQWLPPTPSQSSAPWIMDSGATHHLSSDMEHLNLHSEYSGPEEVHLGSGKRARLEDMSGASKDVIEEVIIFGCGINLPKTKIRGRKKGLKGKLSRQVTSLLGKATVMYAHGQYEEAIRVLLEVIKLAPDVPDSFHTLGLVLIALGNTEKAMLCYEVAAWLMPKNSHLWKTLFSWHSERGDVALARMCLSKALRADPTDVSVRVLHASYLVKLGNLQKAALSYEWISRTCLEDVEALKIAAKLHSDSGQRERGISILEGYLNSNQSGADAGVIELLADLLMETNAHDIALQHIEHAYLDCYEGKEIPFQLKIKAGICHLHLGNIEKAEILFSGLEGNIGFSHSRLIADVANAFMNLGHVHGALKFYHILELRTEVYKVGQINLKIAHCYLSLDDHMTAIKYFYKALHALEDSVDCRLVLTSLLIEDGKEDEAIALLLPPENSDSVDASSVQHESWWLDWRIKLKLCYMYMTKGMIKDFVDTMLPFVRDSLYAKPPQNVKKRLTISRRRKRTKILHVGDAGDVFGGVRPLASCSGLRKATKAKSMLEKKEEAKAADIDWHSDDSDNLSSEEEASPPPLPIFLKDEEHYKLILDLCKALQSLERYWEALELIDLIRRFAYRKLPADVKEELESLAAQMSYKITDLKHGFECMRSFVVKHPYSFVAWNCYYKITSRLGKRYSKHGKFLRYMRNKHADCVPTILITGHQFSMGSYYQDAAREYLAAYKLQPENPLVNLCAGTSLVNLALGFRLQNKNQCLAQGFSFLYKNLQIAENNKVSLQEALYNIARAYHHVGFITLAASYYEKVLQICEKDCLIPKLLNENSDVPENLQPGYCDLRREAAYNLHLIYKKSGAIDLARQILKDHCTF